MPSRQAGGKRGPTALTVAACSAGGIIRHPVLPVYERSRYRGQLKVSCRIAGNVRTAGEPGPVYPAAKAALACPVPSRRGVPCCPEVATRRNAGETPGLSRNCDRGVTWEVTRLTRKPETPAAAEFLHFGRGN